MGSLWSTLVRWAKCSPFSGNFLNQTVLPYSLKALIFLQETEWESTEGLEQVLSNLSFPLNHLGWCKDIGAE